MKTKLLSLAMTAMLALVSSARAQSTAFTYQGRLNDGANPASGIYDLRFAIYDAAGGGAQQGNAITNTATSVSNGVFTVTLDFGNQFPGTDRWLEIGVRTTGGGAFATLSPRQPLTATPYAISAANAGNAAVAATASSVAAANITGTIPLAQLPATVVTNGASGVNISGTFSGNVSGTFSGNGAGLKNVFVDVLQRPIPVPVAWGDNFFGQTNIPGGLSNVVALAGGNHILALKSDGTVVGWGRHDEGQTIIPGGLNNVVAIAAGSFFSLALKGDGTVRAWGFNDHGETAIPGGLVNVAAIAAGGGHSLALKSDGTVVGWGWNAYGQATIPGGLSNVVAIAGGGWHSLALKSDGTVVAWGNNWYGQTTLPDGLSNVVAIAGGFYHNLALKSDGTVVAWGNNSDGQVIVPDGLSNVVAIAGGAAHSLALKSDGTVAAWGSNLAGETTIPGGLNNVLAIAGAGFDSLAIRKAGVPAQVALLTGNNVFQGAVTATSFTGNGSGLTGLNAGNLTGTIAPTNIATVTNWFALTIVNPTPQLDDQFGYSVAAVGGERVLIGARHEDTGADDAGAAYLFSTDGTLLTTFANPTPAMGDQFGYSVAAVGSDRVLIGAIGGTGAAYLFSTNGALLTIVTNPTPGSDLFGNSMAAVGSDRVVIGAPYDNTDAPVAGAVYLFGTDGALLTTFTNPTPAMGDQFGYAVAAVGSDRVLISAIGENVSTGVAYLFSTNGTLLTTFNNPTPDVLDYFGYSVAAVGTDRVLIGTINDTTGANGAGAAYLFSTNGALLTTFTNPTPAYGEWFGCSVAAVGSNRVLIGAYRDDTGAYEAGAAYLFSTDGALLTTFTNPTPAYSELFGYSVAAVGTDRLLISARQDGTGAPSAGAAYLFSLETFTPGVIADGARARSITTASLEDGAVTAAKIGGVLFPSQIPDLDAAKITSGTLADARLSTNVALLTAGKLSDSALSTNVALVSKNNTFSGNQFINGALNVNSPGYGGVASIIRARSGDSIPFAVQDLNGNNLFLVFTNANGQVNISGPAYAQSFNPTSDRNAKENFAPVSSLAVLDKVVSLPISQWNFKTDPSTSHLGPMAQDFYAAFGVGPDDRHIATVDADGVALAAIQGLNQKLVEELKRRDAENAELKARLERLEKLLTDKIDRGAK